MPAKAIPDGYEHVTPYLIIKGAAQAIEFYKKAFGAIELFRMEHQGKIGHAEIKIGGGIVMLADEYPEMDHRSPTTLGGSSVGLLIYVENVDPFFDRAVSAGAKVVKPMQDQFYGDRSGTLTDPYGHMWTFATHKEDVPPAEMSRRAEEWMKSQKK
jgi:PhnB protein